MPEYRRKKTYQDRTCLLAAHLVPLTFPRARRRRITRPRRPRRPRLPTLSLGLHSVLLLEVLAALDDRHLQIQAFTAQAEVDEPVEAE